MWLRRRRLAAAYRELFDSVAGQAVLADLLRAGGILQTSHVPGDACSTAFAEGRRSMALELMARLRWTDGELLQLSRLQDADLSEES
jgi:hypothetical protein